MPIIVMPAEDGRTHIKLEGPLTIMEALDSRDQLALALSTADSAEIDLGGVTEVDCAGLQLLLAMKRTRVPVVFGQVSGPLGEVLGHFNLLSQLGLEP
jgi:ABC-type transporter Mla MlaB component